MKWIKIKAVAVAAGLSLAAVTATTMVVSANLTGPAVPEISGTDVQFKAFLEHPPAYLRAVFEQTMYAEAIVNGPRGRRGGGGPGQDATTTNSLKLDGDNYLLSCFVHRTGGKPVRSDNLKARRGYLVWLKSGRWTPTCPD